MVALAKSYGMPAVGLTDHGNMYGAIDFYKTCKKNGIKPIIGVEAYIAPRTRFDREAGIDTMKATSHLTLLAKNETGYRNLMKLSSKASLEGFYYKPRMDHELLREHREGLICLSGCLGGELAKALWARDQDRANNVVETYLDIFGKENYYIEIMRHPGLPRMEEITDALIDLAHKRKIPLVGTQDCHYLHTSDSKAHDTLLAVQTGNQVDDANRLSLREDDFSFISPEIAIKNFRHTPEAAENTLAIAERVDIELKLGQWVFPNFVVPFGTTHDSELRRLAYEGFPVRNLKKDETYTKRLEYELKVISDKGYAAYFLVVADFIRYASEHDILTNIRGSVAGSLTTYLLHITSVDPITYHIPFERFLNPERPSAPDIDMDFADNRRDEVIDYAKKKYGEDNVAQIGTFGAMLARGSVRDVARALGHPYAIGDKISRLIPMGSQGFPMTIERALKLEPDLLKLYKEDALTTEIIDVAKQLEGCVRHVSVHAAGVVISPTDLTNHVPLQLDPKGGKKITQYDMHAVEDAGLVKFDFLGIRNLAILGDAVKIVERTHGIKIDLDNIPLDDKATYAMLARGETMGLFQLNGAGMTKYLTELRPSTIHDINAMVALYRPGPLESIPEYIRRKHDPTKVKYMDARMQHFLKDSFGIIVYQEDVMLIAIELAGYSWLEADKLRKAMGKKIPKEMEAQKEKLIQGLTGGGMTKERADKLWALIEPFAAYGFGKAHAASYGLVAYQTSYMKANYPAEYMTAVLIADSGDVEKVATIIHECKRMAIPVLPPDVNESYANFTLIKAKDLPSSIPEESRRDTIRFGLATIKNLGSDVVEALIIEREKGGKYKNFSELLDRIRHKNLNRKSLEALIKAGAMDALETRANMLGNLEIALLDAREANKMSQNQSSLFGLMTDDVKITRRTLKQFPEIELTQKLLWEKELLGLYISGHPLDAFREQFAKNGNSIKNVREVGAGKLVMLGGIVEEVREIMTKKNERMAFVRFADFSDSIEIVFFPRIWTDARELVVQDAIVALRATTSSRNDELSLIAEAVKRLDSPLNPEKGVDP